jgi:hypothetical protein
MRRRVVVVTAVPARAPGRPEGQHTTAGQRERKRRVDTGTTETGESMHQELQRGTVATRKFNDGPRAALTPLTVLYTGGSGAGAALTAL